MSWTSVVWSASAGVCLALAAVHLLVWAKSRESWANLAFAIAAASAAASAVSELAMMHAHTPEEYGALVHWLHLAVGVLIVALAWFVHLYLRAGRTWLVWLVCALRAALAVVDLLVSPNLDFKQITGLHQIQIWGETVVVPIGEKTPWSVIFQLAPLLLVVLVIDAAIPAWRRGDRRRAGVVGGAIAGATMSGMAMTIMLHRDMLAVPYSVCMVFLIIVVPMAFELSVDMVRARQLSMDLERSKERMSLAARAAQLGLWEWDLGRDEVWANEVSRERIGAQAPERIDLERFLLRVHPGDRESIRQAVRSAIEGNEGLRIEYRYVATDGAERWAAIQGQVERGPNHQPLRVRGVSLDITDRKQAERERAELHNELAHLGRTTTLNALASSLAHEINQPLGAILRNAEAAELLLKQSPPDLEEVAAIVVDIRKDDQRAAAVIDRMRTLLKRRDMRVEAIPLSQLAKDVADLVKAEVQSRGATLELELPAGLPRVRGDIVHLQQVLLNLLLNGLDAMNGQPGARRLQLEARVADPQTVEVAVTDTGPGIQPEVLPRLFDPFFTTKSEGLGMGLSIARASIESHGGRIWAENQADAGATVRFTLRVADQEGAT